MAEARKTFGAVLVVAGAAVAGGLPRAVAAQAAPERLPHIEGPAPPVPPDVIARDDQGRVTVRAVRLDVPLRLDGRLDEEVYDAVRPVDGFVQQEPQEGAPATEKTEAWIFFDGANLYVAARCWSSRPDAIVATEMRRDHFNVFQNDNFTVVLDTFYDRRSGVFFQTNALSALRDQEVANERNNNNDWNTMWDARSVRFDRGWTVEMVIPFKSLRYQRGGPQVWGINLRRVVRWKNEHSFLSLVPASYGPRGIYKFSSAATLVGVETPARSLNLELKPYAISSVTTNRAASEPFSNRVAGDVGFDLKYGLTRGLIADFTYDTDFAQVEEDEQQVNLTRFSLLFPEKRQFFLEGANIFAFAGVESGSGGPTASIRASPPSSTPILFFSRQIGLGPSGPVPIRAGGRLTGRAGGFTIGALDIQTGDAEDAVATNFAVFRLQRDVLRRSTVGLIATHRSPAIVGDGRNTAAGLDANLAFYENLRVQAYYAATWTSTEPAGGSRASYRGRLEYAGDRYGLELEHLSVGKRFNPEIGFLRRENFRRTFVLGRFSPRPRSSDTIRKVTWEGSLDYTTDPGGTLETREAVGSFRLEFHNNDQFGIDYARSFEAPREAFTVVGRRFAAGGYHFQHARAQYQLGPQRRIQGVATVGRGTFFGGDRSEAGFRGRLEFSEHLAVEPGISVNWIELPLERFTTRLVGARTIVALTPRLFITSLVQYNSSIESFTSSVRLKWEYRPLSDLFIVYSDARDTEPPGSPRLQNRTLAVKLTRLLRF